MNKIFSEMFSRQPNEIIYGNYFYYNQNTTRGTAGVENKGKPKLREWFKSDWDNSILEPENLFYPPLTLMNCGEYEFSMISKVLNKIATEGKPFMDISSGNMMGLIPFILKMNTKIPCMATDIWVDMIEFLNLNINHYLPEYNISLACFDNRDIPIKDNSLDYITSKYGISACGYDNAPQMSLSLMPIKEVYRILKPGGRFITIEQDKKFGTYIYNEIEQNTLYTWYDQFVEAGFEVEIEEKYPLGEIFYVLRKVI